MDQLSEPNFDELLDEKSILTKEEARNKITVIEEEEISKKGSMVLGELYLYVKDSSSGQTIRKNIRSVRASEFILWIKEVCPGILPSIEPSDILDVKSRIKLFEFAMKTRSKLNLTTEHLLTRDLPKLGKKKQSNHS